VNKQQKHTREEYKSDKNSRFVSSVSSPPLALMCLPLEIDFTVNTVTFGEKSGAEDGLAKQMCIPVSCEAANGQGRLAF
jgi:hypothetical protein